MKTKCPAKDSQPRRYSRCKAGFDSDYGVVVGELTIEGLGGESHRGEGGEPGSERQLKIKGTESHHS